MNECVELSPEIEVRQGDIVARLLSGDGIELKLVITADCDFPRRRFGKFVSALPVVPLKAYVDTFVVPEMHTELKARQLRRLSESINSARIAKNRHLKPMSEEAVLNWITRQADKAIATELNIVGDERRTKALLEVLQSAGACLRELSSGCASDLRQYCRCVALSKFGIPKGTSETEVANCLRIESDKLANRLLSSNVDLFLLNSIPSVGKGGFVILLRQIEALDFDLITTRAGEAALNVHKFRRIARLEKTFKHAVAQKFGLLFSRVGLPDAHTEAVKESLGKLEALYG